MLSSLWVLLLGSPIKLAVWIGNRIAAWTTLLLIWRRIRHTPDRIPRLLVWACLINGVSLLFLVGLYRWWAIR